MKVEITHPEKVLFRGPKITKAEVISYYNKVSKKFIAACKDHPIALQRYPNGVSKKGFFQKEIPGYFPSWIKRVKVPLKKGGSTYMLLCNDLSTLLYLANQGSITFHMWLSKKGKLNFPDRMVFDLDPPRKSDFANVKKAALDLKKLLKARKMTAKAYVTGSKGIHVTVSLKGTKSFDEVRKEAKEIAKELVSLDPKSYTIETLKNKRRGRVFIDYLRNSYGQTVVVPYSLRAIKGAPFAKPVSWSELDKLTHAQAFLARDL